MNGPEIKIFLFGPFEVRVKERPIHLGIGGVTKSLLAYLISRAGLSERREGLAEIFWPDACPGKARSAMNTAIWRLKKVLSPLPGMYLDCFENTVCLRIGEGVEVDGVNLVSELKRAQALLTPELMIPRDAAVGSFSM